MLGIAEKGLAAGMNVVRMNQRTCGGTDALAPTFYHSGRSADVAAVAKSLVEKDGLPHFALCGFSMGGNLVLKTAGEWGSAGPAGVRGGGGGLSGDGFGGVGGRAALACELAV